MRQCAAIKPDGARCERIVTAEQEYCYSHDPDRQAERRRNAARGGKGKASGEIPELKAQLRKLAADVLSGEVEGGAAVAINQIFTSLARLIELERRIREQEMLEERVSALEAVLKPRGAR
jgi:hypothetical protein